MLPQASYRHNKAAYAVEEVAELLSLSRAQIYRLLDQQVLGSVKIGRCRRVTADQLDHYLVSLDYIPRNRR